LQRDPLAAGEAPADLARCPGMDDPALVLGLPEYLLGRSDPLARWRDSARASRSRARVRAAIAASRCCHATRPEPPAISARTAMATAIPVATRVLRRWATRSRRVRSSRSRPYSPAISLRSSPRRSSRSFRKSAASGSPTAVRAGGLEAPLQGSPRSSGPLVPTRGNTRSPR